jgi:hypothetical protein
MRKVVAACMAIAVLGLLIASSALAFEGGGRKPSEAPLIAVGEHYTGQLNNHRDDANYNESREVALFRLPPVTTRDVITVDWHGAPYTRSSYSGFPVCLALAQGVDDFSWGSVFGKTTEYRSCDEDGPLYSLSGSGSVKTTITVQETNSSSTYLQFFAWAPETSPTSLETYPYDFTVEPILHYLAAAIPPVNRISAGGVLHATANLATGLPAPDGLPFSLAVSWPDGGVASYTAASAGGSVGFQLALPETAYGKQATFVVSHPADGTYQAVTTSKLEALVAKPKPVPPPPPSLCELAERRELSLARQFKRLNRHAKRARGHARHMLSRRAGHAKRKLRAARTQVDRKCGK